MLSACAVDGRIGHSGAADPLLDAASAFSLRRRGTLEIVSPSGEGTRIEVEILCDS
jgi:hypothetical protein